MYIICYTYSSYITYTCIFTQLTGVRRSFESTQSGFSVHSESSELCGCIRPPLSITLLVTPPIGLDSMTHHYVPSPTKSLNSLALMVLSGLNSSVVSPTCCLFRLRGLEKCTRPCSWSLLSVCNLSSKKTVSPTPHSCSTPLDTLLDSLLDDCIHHFAPHTDITFSPQPPKWLMTWPCSSLRKCPQGQVANLKHRAGSIAEGALRTKAAYHVQSPREGHTCYSARWSWPWSGPAWVANKWILFKSIGRFRFCCRTSWF